MTSFYDARAGQAVNDTAAEFHDPGTTPLINRVASEAVSFINQMIRERPDSNALDFDLAAICRWSAESVAPTMHRDQLRDLGEATEARVRAAMEIMGKVRGAA